MSTLHVHTANDRRSIAIDDAHESLLLSDVLRRADLPLNTRCGQRGLCDGCCVELLSGALICTTTGETVKSGEATEPLRACQHELVPDGQAELHVPARSLLAHAPQVVTDFCANVSRAHDPLWQYIDVPAAEIDQAAPFSEAICRAITRQRDGDLPVRPGREFDSLAESQEVLVHVAIEHGGDHWLIHPASPERSAFGVAVDVGTTTVVAVLVDLASGEVASTASALNAQTRLGDNVLTRIQHCRNDKRLVDRLQRAIVKRTLNPLLDQLSRETGLSADRITCLTVAGNTTMLHLLAGVDPSPLGTAPFTPEFLEHRVLRSSSLPLLPSRTASRKSEPPEDALQSSAALGGLASKIDPAVHLLPGAAAYIGADIIAGVFSTGMIYGTETSILVDMGTNGEIVLKYEDRLLGCATAAGPAFEGAGLACGVRAGRGAISHVRLDEDPLQPQIDVIGGGKPIGVCGTAYVDFVAEARRCGLVKKTGRFSGASAVRSLLRHATHGQSFIVARGRDNEPIVVSEADIASLLQAKAAIAAGIACLLNRAGVSTDDIDTLYLAGGFGFHMDVQNVIRCGLLPGFRPEQIRLVGNTSLAGAYLALLDSGVLAEMKRASKRLETVELNLEPDFESQYIDHLCLPE
jgi:uncharacterized 2Fe-2S/4Fe-4S cluster protein (DUF4445 family)